MPIIACAREADLQRVGDRDDLHDAGVEQPLHALADGGLGQADGLADRGVRPPAVLLQLLDDRLRDVVEGDAVAAILARHGARSLPPGVRFGKRIRGLRGPNFAESVVCEGP